MATAALYVYCQAVLAFPAAGSYVRLMRAGNLATTHMAHPRNPARPALCAYGAFKAVYGAKSCSATPSACCGCSLHPGCSLQPGCR